MTRNPLPPPTTAPAASSGDGSVEGRDPSAKVPRDQVTPTTPASSDSARGFGAAPERGFDLSVHLYGGASARLPW